MPSGVLHEMRSECQGFFDPTIEAAFYRIVPPFPIGQLVELNNGLEAVVIDFNPDFPTRPTVQLLRVPGRSRLAASSHEEVDLASCTELSIARVDGQDISR